MESVMTAKNPKKFRYPKVAPPMSMIPNIKTVPMDRSLANLAGGVIWLESLRRATKQVDDVAGLQLLTYNAFLRQPENEESLRKLTRFSWVPSWAKFRKHEPIDLLEELDFAELLYSGLTRFDTVERAEDKNLSVFLNSIVDCHKIFQEHFGYFSTWDVIYWALGKFGHFRYDLFQKDQILEISTEKFFRLLVHGKTFFDYKRLDSYDAFDRY